MTQRCEVCGADITGHKSIEHYGRPAVQRTTCYLPEDCADRLMVVRDAWKALAAHALASRRNKAKIRAAVETLKRLGEA